MDDYGWRVMALLVLLTTTFMVRVESRSSLEKDASATSLQLVIPGKGHVEWLPHSLRPPLQEVHSIFTSSAHKRHRRQNSQQLITTPIPTPTLQHVSNDTETTPSHGQYRGFVSDKEIVVIVVCSSIGLVICLLGVAISAKFYWRKVRRDSGGNYQGVLQKDNSSLSDDTSGLQSQRDKDGRLGHANMFAQIDEMDEEGSCPSSPALKDKVLQNGGEIKAPLEATPTPTALLLTKQPPSPEKLEEEISETQDMITTTVEVEVLTNDSSSFDAEVESRIYCRTGLSQSDCSLSSYTSVNPTYKYGNQVAYMAGYYGYPCSSDQLLISPCADTQTPPSLLAPPPLGHKQRFDIPIPKDEELILLMSDAQAVENQRDIDAKAMPEDETVPLEINALIN